MSLKEKSLTELRSIAQSMGIIPRYDVGKEHLLQQISSHVTERVQAPTKPIEVNIIGGADDRALTQASITEAMKGFAELGLVVTFPDSRTWELSCNGKRDSGTMSMSLWNIVNCAKELVKS